MSHNFIQEVVSFYNLFFQLFQEFALKIHFLKINVLKLTDITLQAFLFVQKNATM